MTTGFTFGAPSASSAAGFNFGATPSSTQSTGFGAFGLGSTAVSGPSLGFGMTSTAQTGTASGSAFGATGMNLFNTTTTQSTGFGGFGTQPTAGAFGTQPNAGAFGTQPAAGAFGTQNTGLFGTQNAGGFGTQTAGGSGLFGTGTSGLGAGTGFGTGSGNAFKPGGGIGGTTGASFPQAGTSNETAAANLRAAVTSPAIFGDERDQVLARWNQLQSCWGVGRGYFNQQGAFVEFRSDNPFSLLKAVGYSCISESKNEDGLVNIVFGRSQAEVLTNQQQIVDAIHKLLGGRPNHIVCVDSIRSLLDDKCEMTTYIQDRQVTGVMMRITASELFNFLNQQNIRQQLTSQLCVSDVYIKVAMTKEQMKYYLDNPPAGIDHRIWEQAKIDNPDPEKLIPVPIVGFSELHQRLRFQEKQTDMHRLRLEVISSDLGTLKSNLNDMVSKIDEFKRKQLLLSHRVLQVMVKQEISRKQGYAIQAEEEQLRAQLEMIAAELNAPTQFKGRLNELMSQIRMQNQASVSRSDVGFQVSEEVKQEVKQHLGKQQEGIVHLMQILKEDLSDLKIIEQGLLDTAKFRR